MIKEYAGPIDVELYLWNFDGINIAMNRFSPDRYNGKLAQKYLQNLEHIRHSFATGTEYVKYIPIFVWSSKCCQLIKIHFEMKQQKVKLIEAQDKVSQSEKSIEQIKVLEEMKIPISEITDFTAISWKTDQMMD